MAATHAKFTFDLDMSRPRDGRLPRDAELHQAVVAARQEGHAEGMIEGQASEVSRAAQAMTAAAERIANLVAQSAASLDASRKQTEREAILLARIVAGKLAASLLAKEPEAELETLLVECLSALDHAPHLVIRCHPDLADAINDIAEARIKSSGFSGRLMVLGEPEIALTDGRLEWVDGGVARDSAAIEAQVDAQIAAYFSEQGIVPDQGTKE